MRMTLLLELILERTKSWWNRTNGKKRKNRKRYFDSFWSILLFISRNWKFRQIDHQNDQDQNHRWSPKLVRVPNQMSAVHLEIEQNHRDLELKKILKKTRFRLHLPKARKQKTNQCVSIRFRGFTNFLVRSVPRFSNFSWSRFRGSKESLTSFGPLIASTHCTILAITESLKIFS